MGKPKSFSARVRARMAAAGIRPPKLRAELASRGLEVSRSAVHNWVSGSSAPGLDHALMILDLLAVPRSEQLAWIDALAEMPDRGRDTPAPPMETTDMELADQLRRRAGVAFEAGDDELAVALRQAWVALSARNDRGA